MLDLVRCPSCGMPIGAIYEAYIIIKNYLYEKELEKYEIDETTIGNIDYVEIRMKKILDQFHLKNICCRQHILTSMDFDKAEFLYENKLHAKS